jgi:hypothetical protein
VHLGSISSNSLCIVGTGINILFWTDNWLGEPLVSILQIAPIFHADFTSSVADVIINGG